MTEGLIELGVSVLIAVASLACVAWIVASGQIAYMDGIAFALIALTIGVFFLFSVYWSYRTSELKSLLQARHSKRNTAETSSGSGAKT